MIHNYLRDFLMTIPKITFYFYSIFLLLSSSYHLMRDFGEYSLETNSCGGAYD